MPATSCSAPTPSPFASRAIVPSRGSRTALSSREISVVWSPVFADSCSWVSLARERHFRRFAANRSSGVTTGILGEVGQ